MSGYLGRHLLWVLPPCRVRRVGRRRPARWGWTFMHGIRRLDRVDWTEWLGR
jgi:hypothetical protein